MAEKDRKVKARSGETLCEIAIERGTFLNCDPLRAHPDNSATLLANLIKGTSVTVPAKKQKKDEGKATKAKHVFKRKMAPPPDIRFVHGSPDLPWRDDVALKHLSVSNYPSDKGGYYPTTASGPVSYGTMPALPSGFGYARDGHRDVDTFKIEVVDAQQAADTIKVQLTALKPVYVGGKVDRHQKFAAADPDSASRSIEVECKRVEAGLKVFRSRYMRLVTNINDFNAINANKQALLVSPMSDGNAGAADQVEVLDQRVRAEYELSSCKASSGPKCTLMTELPVGNPKRRRRVKAVVHVLRNGRGGTGVTTIQQARKALGNFVREIYAQADLGFELIAPGVQLVQPPGNMIVISNRRGRRAEGGKTISVRVRVDAADNTVSITTRAGHTPRQTANRLAKEIRKVCKETAVVSRNPPIIGRAVGSADILVGNPQSQNVRLTIVTSADRQRASIARIAGTQIKEYSGDDAHVGTMDERVLIKNYDTGRDRIDTFLVGSLHQSSYGEAWNPDRKKKKNRRPRRRMVNTVLLQASTQTGTTTAHTTVAHEWAHVLMDAVHITNPSNELIFKGSPVGANEQVVNAPRRIGDPPNNRAYRVVWDGNVNGNPVKRLRTKNRSLLKGW